MYVCNDDFATDAADVVLVDDDDDDDSDSDDDDYDKDDDDDDDHDDICIFTCFKDCSRFHQLCLVLFKKG